MLFLLNKFIVPLGLAVLLVQLIDVTFFGFDAVLHFPFGHLHLYFNFHSLLRVIVARDVLELLAINKALLDAHQASDADEDSQGVVEDVGDEIPEALVGRGVGRGKGDGNGEIDEVRHHLRN